MAEAGLNSKKLCRYFCLQYCTQLKAFSSPSSFLFIYLISYLFVLMKFELFRKLPCWHAFHESKAGERLTGDVMHTSVIQVGIVHGVTDRVNMAALAATCSRLSNVGLDHKLTEKGPHFSSFFSSFFQSHF